MGALRRRYTASTLQPITDKLIITPGIRPIMVRSAPIGGLTIATIIGTGIIIGGDIATTTATIIDKTASTSLILGPGSGLCYEIRAKSPIWFLAVEHLVPKDNPAGDATYVQHLVAPDQ